MQIMKLKIIYYLMPGCLNLKYSQQCGIRVRIDKTINRNKYKFGNRPVNI